MRLAARRAANHDGGWQLPIEGTSPSQSAPRRPGCGSCPLAAQGAQGAFRNRSRSRLVSRWTAPEISDTVVMRKAYSPHDQPSNWNSKDTHSESGCRRMDTPTVGGSTTLYLGRTPRSRAS